MNLDAIKELRKSIDEEIQEFIITNELYYNSRVKEYILQNAKYKVGDKFNHPVIGEIVIKEIHNHLNYRTFDIYYSTDKDDYLSEEELDKSEKIEMTVQERLDKIFYEDISLENNLPVVIKGYIDEITEYYEGR